MEVISNVQKTAANILQKNAGTTISNAFLSDVLENGDKILTTIWKQKAYEISKAHEFTHIYNFSNNGTEPTLKKLNNFAIPSTNFVLQTMSPSGSFLARIITQSNKETQKNENLLEIWSKNDGKCNLSFNLSAADKHGSINSDFVFGALSWSFDERKLCYVAEKKKPKNIGYFDTEKNECSAAEFLSGEKFNYEDSWGEQLSKVVNPVVCVFDLKDKSIFQLSDYPDNICPAQPSFIESDTIVFEGIEKEPFKLGRMYCENRESDIYTCNLDSGHVSCLTANPNSKDMNMDPRVSPDGKKLLCLHKKLSVSGDPHRSAAEVMIINLESNKSSIITEVNFDGASYPLYCESLVKNCWFSNNTDIVIQNVINFQQYFCVIDISTKTMKSKHECNALFGVFSDVILSSVMKLNWSNCVLQVSTAEKHILAENPIKLNFDVHSIDNDGIISFCLLPQKSMLKNDKFPVIVWPHGGPHSVRLNSYNLYAASFAELGFAVIFSNFRGSTGHTEETLRSLPGHIGDFDTLDVHTVTQLFFEKFGNKYDRENIFMFGGSHGGFIAAHHIGQYPELYRAAVLRNPVIEITSMSSVSDIPDWTYIESGLPYQQNMIPNASNYKVMLDKSPIQYTRNINAPVLLCIGDRDERVPPSQGKFYYKLLKANNKIVKLLLYPEDCHPLASVDAECDVFVNSIVWFLKYGKSLEMR